MSVSAVQMLRNYLSRSAVLKAASLGSYRVSKFHVTKYNENNLIFGGLAIAATSMGLSYALAAYRKLPKESTESKQPIIKKEGTSTKKEKSQSEQEAKMNAEEVPTSLSSLFSSFDFSTIFARTFYDGGFEEKMTRREAALILGVRESASIERVKDAHRRILLLNHPDRGGSAFLAAKINEAKDLLLKGRP